MEEAELVEYLHARVAVLLLALHVTHGVRQVHAFAGHGVRTASALVRVRALNTCRKRTVYLRSAVSSNLAACATCDPREPAREAACVCGCARVGDGRGVQ